MSLHSGLPFPLVGGRVPEEHRGDPWFNDGTAILVSGNTAFKVYKGLLARDSQVFADLFAAPPAHRYFNMLVEGCEVIRMEESVSKLAPVLKWIHVGIGKRFPSYDNFEALTSMFSMASFYQLHSLREILIQPLLKHYLLRLRAYQSWDGTPATATSGSTLTQPTSANAHPLTAPLNPVHALNFARSYDVRVLSLVPIILVDLTLWVSEAELLSASEPRRAQSSPYKPGLNSSEDEEVCAELWEWHKGLGRSVGRVLERFGRERPFKRRVRCCEFKAFYEGLVQRLDARANEGTSGSGGGGWLTESHGRYALELIRAVRTDGARAQFCEECLREVDREVMEEYRRWWEGIPRVLGLEGGWEDEVLGDLTFGEDEAWRWD